MRIKYLGQEKGFISLLGLLLSLAITCFLFYILFNVYFRVPATRENPGNDTFSQAASIPVSDYKSIVNTTKSKLQDINKKEQERLNSFMQEK